MRTNIVLDDDLMEEAIRLTGITVKRQLVEEALRTLIRQHRRPKISDLVGRDLLDQGYDHKEARRGDRDHYDEDWDPSGGPKGPS